MEAGKSRLKGDTLREANKAEVDALKRENERLKELVAQLSVEEPGPEKKPRLEPMGKPYVRREAQLKAEVLQIVERSPLPVRQTLQELQIAPSTYYRWKSRYRDKGFNGLVDRPPEPRRVWNRLAYKAKTVRGQVCIGAPIVEPERGGDHPGGRTGHVRLRVHRIPDTEGSGAHQASSCGRPSASTWRRGIGEGGNDWNGCEPDRGDMTKQKEERLMNERLDLIPAALYARVSSDRQDVDLSVAAQLRALRDYAEKNGYLVAREYVDEAESGRIARPAPVPTDAG